jgi:transcriptional regulator of aromatic amino acid metabolism
MMERTPLAPGYGLGDPGFVLEQLQGDSPAWREAKSLLPRVAESDLPVLLLGETGTGKELMARAVHALSPRRRRAFVAMNLRSHARQPDRERVVRPRARRVHRRGG